MENNLTLVIMAAGLGSRFGGLKQLTPVGPSGEFIIDYSVYDAVRAGFNKIVFIIKRELLTDFKETIGDRISKHVAVEYVFQDNNMLPEGYSVGNRIKPLGTGHAVYCVKDVVNEPFAVITADDFYGKDAFIEAASFLKSNANNQKKYGMITSPVINTMVDDAPVKRGICQISDNQLVNIIESSVEFEGTDVVATSLNTGTKTKINPDTPASLSYFLFQTSMFNYLEQELVAFLEKNKENLDTVEFFLPDVVATAIKDGCSVSIYNVKSNWHGITYQKDLDEVKLAIETLINKGDYSNKLWS